MKSKEEILSLLSEDIGETIDDLVLLNLAGDGQPFDDVFDALKTAIEEEVWRHLTIS